MASFVSEQPPPTLKVGDRQWEHSNWFFWIIWRGNEFQIDLEPLALDTISPTWHLGITRVRGIFSAIFGNRENSFDVPDEFLQEAGGVLQQTAGCGPIAWITEDEAIDSLYG